MKKSTSTFITLSSLTLIFVSAVFAQELGSPSDTEITTTDCENAWNTSPASSSCTTTVLSAEAEPGQAMVNTCAVKANCAATADGPHDTFSDFHGGPDGVETLVNCSGDLKLPDNCAS